MDIVRDMATLRARLAMLRQEHGAVGLVPTMGALHAGHLALVAAARRHGAAVASIFVNPKQFNQGDDFSRYPRDEAADIAALTAAGCAMVWMPDVETMYPSGDATAVEVAGPSAGWEGAHRPGHFRGVATVVARLFGQAQPERAFFGEKDWQQCQVVRRMAADLFMPLEVVLVPTVREPDGLAMSSRNRFLTAAERATAPVLYRVLCEAADALAGGAAVETTLALGRATLEDESFAPDYLALVNAETMEAQPVLRSPARLITAAHLGTVRLLDNVAVTKL